MQRLPGYAFPGDTRGIAYGSMSLTFHGLQWPYMPARGRGSRFVVGLSGWGWVDTSYQKFAPWGDNPSIDKSRAKYWIQQARLVLRVTPDLLAGQRLVRPGPSRVRRHRGSDDRAIRYGWCRSPTISGCASASGTSGTS